IVADLDLLLGPDLAHRIADLLGFLGLVEKAAEAAQLRMRGRDRETQGGRDEQAQGALRAHHFFFALAFFTGFSSKNGTCCSTRPLACALALASLAGTAISPSRATCTGS